MNELTTEMKLRELVRDISMVLVLDAMPANKINDERCLELASACKQIIKDANSGDASMIGYAWNAASNEFGFDENDDMDDVWMSVRLTVLEDLNIEP